MPLSQATRERGGLLTRRLEAASHLLFALRAHGFLRAGLLRASDEVNAREAFSCIQREWHALPTTRRRHPSRFPLCVWLVPPTCATRRAIRVAIKRTLLCSLLIAPLAPADPPKDQYVSTTPTIAASIAAPASPVAVVDALQPSCTINTVSPMPASTARAPACGTRSSFSFKRQWLAKHHARIIIARFFCGRTMVSQNTRQYQRFRLPFSHELRSTMATMCNPSAYPLS